MTRHLPIACTLGAEDSAQRVTDWRRVLAEAGLGNERNPGQLVLRFADGPRVGAELARLVDAERQCCAFLGWSLTNGNGEWRVLITGADDELRTLSFD